MNLENITMLLQKKLISSLFATGILLSLSACSNQPNVYLQIANYEKAESSQPYYKAPDKTTNEINDEMTAFVQQVELIESSNSSFRASKAISELTGIVKDTVDTNNTVANMKLDDVLVSENPIDVGLKYADNWNQDNMEKIREISDAKIAKSKDVAYLNLKSNEVAISTQDFGTQIEKLFDSQKITILSDKQYSNYYDLIARSTL